MQQWRNLQILDIHGMGFFNVDKTFKEKHKILATAVVEAIQEKNEWVGASSQDIPARYMDYHFLQTGNH